MGFYLCFPNHSLCLVFLILFLREILWLLRGRQLEILAYRCHILWMRQCFIDVLAQYPKGFGELLAIRSLSITLKNMTLHTVGISLKNLGALFPCSMAVGIPILISISCSTSSSTIASSSATSMSAVLWRCIITLWTCSCGVTSGSFVTHVDSVANSLVHVQSLFLPWW